MKKLPLFVIALCTLFLLNMSLYAQSTKAAKEIWYVWIDTEVPIDGKLVRIISNRPSEISCCLKSPKYRKFVKKTNKWIVKNISPQFKDHLSLYKIQDLLLAEEMVATAKLEEGVRIINYNAVCK